MARPAPQMASTSAPLSDQVHSGVEKVNRIFRGRDVVELGGIEPPTSTLLAAR